MPSACVDHVCASARRHKMVPVSMVTRETAELLHYGRENADALVKNFLNDGTVLVWDTEANGRGSENYIDNARLLGPEHLKCIDDYIDETHAEGGTVSLAQCADILSKAFPKLYVSNGCIRYAMVHFCNVGGGFQWGNVKPRKCETDPDRVDVKRTYLRDYAAALKKEEAGTHVCVYFDESYIHQNHAAGKSWLKYDLEGNFINRGRSKGKRLIILHGAILLFTVSLLPAGTSMLTLCCCALCSDHEAWAVGNARPCRPSH